MFRRTTYKKVAKAQLKGRWKTCVLTMLISTLVVGAFSLPQVYENYVAGKSFNQIIENINDDFDIHEESDSNHFNYSFKFQPDVKTYKPKGSPFGLLIFLFQCFVTGAIILTLSNFYLTMGKTTNPLTMKHYFDGFTSCIKGFLGYLWFCLWVFLWSLLFFIPGIVKAFAYSQMFFIMAEYPHIDCVKAMRISKIMTKGSKGDLFVMWLSFIGYTLLDVITFGIAGLWIKPYKMMSFTNAYQDMKMYALQTGMLSEKDFAEEDFSSEIPFEK